MSEEEEPQVSLWGHWCYEQEPVQLPTSTPRCPQCGALNIHGRPE